MSEMVAFWKYHGLGNDFVLVERSITAEEARSLCHRRLGVGGDGVLIVTKSQRPRATSTVEVINSDGSSAEICGNGLRCVALHLHESAPKPGGRYCFETGAGPRECVMLEHPRLGQAMVEVEMGRPTLERREVPVEGEGSMIEESVEVGGRSLSITAVGMGNPHAVMFGAFTPDDVKTMGPELERHTMFPAGANVGFATMSGRERVELIVWERGAGLTGACGSGACAAAVAACVTGRADRGQSIVVAQPGGELMITVLEGDSMVRMTGPTRRAFSGQVEVDLLR